MSGQQTASALKEFREKTITELAQVLHSKAADLRGDQKEFFKLVRRLYDQATRALGEVMVAGLLDFDLQTVRMIFGRIIADFNGALPMDYPFAIAFGKSQEPPGDLSIMVIPRTLIPGLHDLLNPAFAPFCLAKTNRQLRDGEFTVRMFRFPEDEEEMPDLNI